MMLKNSVDIALFVILCLYESKLYDFFLYVKNIEHQTLVSFLLLTSIISIIYLHTIKVFL
jgi:hypothetical protein